MGYHNCVYIYIYTEPHMKKYIKCLYPNATSRLQWPVQFVGYHNCVYIYIYIYIYIYT
jgi:hypothetical protein